MIRDSTTWVIGGPKTFRLASRKILRRWGGNLQNIEGSMREIYIPDDGYMFSQTDQSGAEALIVAYLCEAGAFRQLFIHGVKPHTYVAMHLFKDVWRQRMKDKIGPIPFDIDAMCSAPIASLKSFPYWKDLSNLIKSSDDWPANERYYYLAKQTCHSSNYGIESNTFRMNILEKSEGKIVLPKEEATRFLLIYHSLFPEIQDWHRRLKRQVEQTNILYNLFGHPYQLTGYQVLESQWKEIYAWIAQSTVGMITNIAFCSLQEFVEKEKLNWDNLINGHDSILSQAPINEIIDLGKKQKEFIEQEFISPVDNISFRMRSETKIGLNWSNYREGINEQGLKEIQI
jgi:DNA polymerase I-like protein with 3'-5' exonuclease and polymerase domains